MHYELQVISNGRKESFLELILNEEVFVKQPKGFQDSHFPDVLRLKKALYGAETSTKSLI